jgi:hypothetical protein
LADDRQPGIQSTKLAGGNAFRITENPKMSGRELCPQTSSDRRARPQQTLGTAIGRRWSWRLLFTLRKRLSHFAGVLDEEPGNRAERAVLQGDDSIWNAWYRQLNGQNLQLRAPRRKSQ